MFLTPVESSGTDGKGRGRAEGGEEYEDTGFADGSTAMAMGDGHVGEGPEPRKDLVEDWGLGVFEGAERGEEVGVEYVSCPGVSKAEQPCYLC